MIRYAELVLRLHVLKVLQLLHHIVLLLEVLRARRHLVNHLLRLKVKRWLGLHLWWKLKMLVARRINTCGGLNGLCVVSLPSYCSTMEELWPHNNLSRFVQ